ncbi:Sodium-dependent neutral amino acid transporter B(0)AT2 [Portunus trituberculatus]|uniref:Sodium-dependent neutral amino acid transporter B(0)AT2 n=1 Tax=Portunus trituberculatus TaxID=210409 RepID=A0A5B7HKB4_PORTR|nr:Sodium-dependent neutral amino acid transporter B(0)AT2 [Portunus trituberculatus]
MQYEECVNNNDNILMERINTTDVISIDANTVLLTDGTNITIPELQKCDLQETLRNSASGTGLAFIVFTEAINQFPWAPFWSVLFFLMLFTLGIDSEFGTLEGVITSVVDLKVFPNLRKEFLTGKCNASSQKPSSLSPRLFSKATEMISRVLKGVSSVNNIEILFIYQVNHRNTLKNLCNSHLYVVFRKYVMKVKWKARERGRLTERGAEEENEESRQK